MKIGITGSHGLIGSALVTHRENQGDDIRRLPRPSVTLPLETIEGLDAIVHLAGENIAGRWTADKKKQIHNSRVYGTRELCENFRKLNQLPKILVSASAIGYYGSRGDEILNEDCSLGTGFLANVCREWEEATEAARGLGIRVVHLRTGVVLSPIGGALKEMLLPFKLGLGGVIGDGQQWLSWVSLDDAIGAIAHILQTENLDGAVNVVSPQPVTNREFTKTLGKILKRPTIFPMPKFAARLAFGEMAEDTLLSSTRVEPVKLLATGYKFQFPDLADALRHLL